MPSTGQAQGFGPSSSDPFPCERWGLGMRLDTSIYSGFHRCTGSESVNEIHTGGTASAVFNSHSYCKLWLTKVVVCAMSFRHFTFCMGPAVVQHSYG